MSEYYKFSEVVIVKNLFKFERQDFVKMTNAQLFSKLAVLPSGLKAEVADFVDFLTYKTKKEIVKKKRVAGKAKGLVSLKDDFDDPVPGFEEYTK